MDHLSQEVWCERPFDIVITDLTLVDGCGQDLLPVAGTLKPRPRLGVIASRLDGGTALSIAHQCDIAIAKPLDRSALIRVLKRLSVRDAHAGIVDEFAQRSRLSRRETELLQAAVQGLNNDEIAAALGCDRSTVGTYWSRIFRKTGASSPRAVLGLIIRSYGSNTNDHAGTESPASRD
jgi:DNA-binding NarL/FixJ family response regulator